MNEPRSRSQLLQHDLLQETGALLDKIDLIKIDLDATSKNIKREMSAAAAEAATTALLIALDKIMQPAKAEVALLVTDISHERARFNDARRGQRPQKPQSSMNFYFGLAIGSVVTAALMYFILR